MKLLDYIDRVRVVFYTDTSSTLSMKGNFVIFKYSGRCEAYYARTQNECEKKMSDKVDRKFLKWFGYVELMKE